MLDNAIEASEREIQSELYVSISRRRGYETILVKNKIGKSVLQVNPHLESTKEEKDVHGMGIRQIQELVKKYDGFLTVKEEDGCFSLKILMPIPG